MIKRIILLLAIVLLSGCAQWQTMTPQQKNVVIGAVVTGIIIGVLVAEDDVTRLVDEHDDFSCRGNCSF